jgi:hypothetical protein
MASLMHIAQKAGEIISLLSGLTKNFLLKGNIRASASASAFGEKGSIRTSASASAFSELAWGFGETDKAAQEQVSGAGGQQQLGPCPKTVSNPFLATGGSGCDRLV